VIGAQDEKVMAKQFLTSITRVSDLAEKPFEVRALSRGEWAGGDYVVCEVTGEPGPLYRVELVSGRRTPVLPGDLVVGALGRRAATLECVGDWRDVGEDLTLHQLTGAGLFGKVVSNSRWVGRPMELLYRGHAVRGAKVNIADFVCPVARADFDMPVVLVVGTSMSAGKTLTMRIVIDQLKKLGHSLVAAKLTGAAGYKDALSFGDAGANHFTDYVEAGLVSSVCERAEYAAGLETLLDKIAGFGTGLAVCEIGASPQEPYNGDVAIERIKPYLRLTALCASDPYAVHGFCATCGIEPDFVAGPAANNAASAALVKKLTGLPAFDLGAAEGLAALRTLLEDKLGTGGLARGGKKASLR
jgi:hypothetical protein